MQNVKILQIGKLIERVFPLIFAHTFLSEVFILGTVRLFQKLNFLVGAFRRKTQTIVVTSFF